MDSSDEELWEDHFDDFLEVISRPRRKARIRIRIEYMVELDDRDFRTRFRFTKPGVLYIHDLIESKIKTLTSRNAAIGSLTRLLLTLRYYATGSYLMAAGDFAGVSEASASRIVFEVSKEIALLCPTFVKLPTDLGKLKKDFYEIAKFPNVIGAIDCTHIKIKKPDGDNSEVYRNRKSLFTFNVQAVVSAKLEILDVVARWPGSCHDQTIFDNSLFKRRLYAGQFGRSVIVGDSGYGNDSHVLTPISTPNTPAESLYNESQIRTRNVVERSFGVWKSRFPVLRRTITLSLDRVQPVIVACAVLHNIACMLKEDHFPVENTADEMLLLEPFPDMIIQNETVRNMYISYFSRLLS